MTTALMANVSALRKLWSEATVQIANVASPADTATTTRTAAARSARRCPGALELWAFSTSAMIWPSAVSAPILVASMTTLPVRLIEPPTTSSPSRFSTGIDSPVTKLSSMLELPVTMRPSTGTLLAGRRRMRSPTTISAVGSTTSSPSRRTVVVGGTMSNSALRLSLVPLRLFISIQWPNRTKVTSMVAAS